SRSSRVLGNRPFRCPRSPSRAPSRASSVSLFEPPHRPVIGTMNGLLGGRHHPPFFRSLLLMRVAARPREPRDPLHLRPLDGDERMGFFGRRQGSSTRGAK